MRTVITYQSPRGEKINLTPAQCSMLSAAGKWPKDRSGEEYCTVSHGRHQGRPTYSDEELRKEFSLVEIA